MQLKEPFRLSDTNHENTTKRGR